MKKSKLLKKFKVHEIVDPFFSLSELLSNFTLLEKSFVALNSSFEGQMYDLDKLENNFDHQKKYGLPNLERSCSFLFLFRLKLT